MTAAGDLVYSSASRLYVATTSGGAGARRPATPRVPRVATTAGARVRPRRWRDDVHRVGVVPRAPSRTAGPSASTTAGCASPRSSPAPGGRSTTACWCWPSADGRLVETGRVDGLGRGESIRSVRWFGDLAIVVTFRQTDPLYTVDLADPDRPRVVGELQDPGLLLLPAPRRRRPARRRRARRDRRRLRPRRAGRDVRPARPVRRAPGGHAGLRAVDRRQRRHRPADVQLPARRAGAGHAGAGLGARAGRGSWRCAWPPTGR